MQYQTQATHTLLHTRYSNHRTIKIFSTFGPKQQHLKCLDTTEAWLDLIWTIPLLMRSTLHSSWTKRTLTFGIWLRISLCIAIKIWEKFHVHMKLLVSITPNQATSYTSNYRINWMKRASPMHLLGTSSFNQHNLSTMDMEKKLI
jgi:hypothetical protein